MSMKATVYIDGFNLYYGSLKKTPFRWLDIRKLSEMMLSDEDSITRLKYFTATVSSPPWDPGQSTRQQVYLRALRTIPNLTIHLGHFLSNNASMPLADSWGESPKFVTVKKSEEKGTDVNLAVHLLHDAHRGNFDLALVISNDSDLLEAVRIVRRDLGKPVGILNPHPSRPSKVLAREASFFKNIRKGIVAACQFPDILTDDRGEFHKPAEW